MDNIKNIAIGGIITVLLGGTAYTINKADVAQNFANDTGLTTEQAEQYINGIPQEELATWNEVGNGHIQEGDMLLVAVNELDCENYEYTWESSSLSCIQARNQLRKLGQDSHSLGKSFLKLASDSASKDDIRETIRLIDQINSGYELEVVQSMLNPADIDEARKTNLYNKAVLKTVLESEQE